MIVLVPPGFVPVLVVVTGPDPVFDTVEEVTPVQGNVTGGGGASNLETEGRTTQPLGVLPGLFTLLQLSTVLELETLTSK